MKHAFSLVELSIVLVILGLLVGGILTGQSLIRAAELRSVTTEFSNYQTAVMTFRDRYMGLPGDMPNATDFWGADTNGCPNGGGTIGSCSGDGDGMLSSYYGGSSDKCEAFEFWRHLAVSGLIDGSYAPPTATNCAEHPTRGDHYPASRLSDAGWMVSSLGSITSSGTWPGTAYYTANYGNTLTLGSGTGVNHQMLRPTSISSEEAWNIDIKIDDGQPDEGSVLVIRDTVGYGNSCTNDDTPGTAEYDIGNGSTACALLFKDAF